MNFPSVIFDTREAGIPSSPVLGSTKTGLLGPCLGSLVLAGKVCEVECDSSASAGGVKRFAGNTRGFLNLPKPRHSLVDH